jgi:hypothetical protein
MTPAAPQLCPGSTYLKEFNCLWIGRLSIADTVFGPIYQYIITEQNNTRFELLYTKTTID